MLEHALAKLLSRGLLTLLYIYIHIYIDIQFELLLFPVKLRSIQAGDHHQSFSSDGLTESEKICQFHEIFSKGPKNIEKYICICIYKFGHMGTKTQKIFQNVKSV